MSEMGTLMYAELLPNIRQISVVAALATPSNGSTKAKLSDGGQHVILCHDGITTTLNLPGQVASHAQLQRFAFGSAELSWRLPLVGVLTRVDFDSALSNDATWPAKDLDENTEYACRGCGAILVMAGTVEDWRDMPSENWAEMMDFWHCHKPSDQGTNVTSVHDIKVAANKGYGANTNFRAQVGVGFVDLMTFLVASNDCPNIQTAPPQNEGRYYQKLSCRVCHKYIGYFDHEAEGYRLYKWRLSLLPSAKYTIFVPQPSLSSIVSSQLLAIIQSQCTSRLILYPTGWSPPNSKNSFKPLDSTAHDGDSAPSDTMILRKPSPSFLCIWSLVPSLRISSTSGEQLSGNPPTTQISSTNLGMLAMKVFWRQILAEEGSKLMDDANFEQLALPEEAILQLESSLEESAQLLPPSMRKFKEWGMGLLERYEENR